MTQEEKELQELAELEELAQLEALAEQEQQPDPYADKKAQAQASVEAKSQEYSDMAVDAFETTTAAFATFPGAKQIGSMINATADMVMAEDRNESFSEAYQRNLNTVNSAIDDAREKHPYAMFANETAVGLAGAAGLVQAGATTTAAQIGTQGGVNLAGEVVKQTPKTISYGMDIAYAMADAGSEYRGSNVYGQLEQMFGAGTLASGVMALGIGASKGMEKLSRKVDSVAEETVLGALNPKVNKKVLRETNNIVKFRYGGDYNKAAKHADEIMGLSGNTPITGPKKVAENIDRVKKDIGIEIESVVDYVDDSSFLLNGGKKPINGGILQAELKNTVGSSRFRRDLPDVLQDDYTEIDEFIDALTLENRMVKAPRKVQTRVDAPNYGGGNHSKMEEVVEAAEYEKTARQLGAKDIFKMKVKVADKIEDVFLKKLDGKSMTPSKVAQLKAQQARIVGKFSDVIDKQAKIVADETGDQMAIQLSDLNKKYALATHLGALAEDTVATTSYSAPAIFQDMFAFKGLFIASAVGIQTGDMATTGAVMIAQALAKQPRVPFKVAQGLTKLSNFMRKYPTDQLSAKAVASMVNAANPDETQKALGGIIAEIDLIESVQAGQPIPRDVDSVIGMRNTIGAVIRNEMGEEAASQFHNAIDDEDYDSLGAMMDQLSKTRAGRKYIAPGIGWDGKVYDPADKAQLEEEVRRANLPAAQEIMLLEELKQNKVPNIQPVQPTTRAWTPRDRSKHQY